MNEYRMKTFLYIFSNVYKYIIFTGIASRATFSRSCLKITCGNFNSPHNIDIDRIHMVLLNFSFIRIKKILIIEIFQWITKCVNG